MAKANDTCNGISGCELDEEGKPNRWRVENSWGDAPGKKAIMS